MLKNQWLYQLKLRHFYNAIVEYYVIDLINSFLFLVFFFVMYMLIGLVFGMCVFRFLMFWYLLLVLVYVLSLPETLLWFIDRFPIEHYHIYKVKDKRIFIGLFYQLKLNDKWVFVNSFNYNNVRTKNKVWCFTPSNGIYSLVIPDNCEKLTTLSLDLYEGAITLSDLIEYCSIIIKL